ncbi:MAG: NADH:flavin oxidoreductase/NADH oxidase [Flavitalea sp.]
MAGLFDILTIRGIEFRNRITVSPMCQYSSVDGFANDWHLVHLGSRAVGGAGLVLTEATAVSPEGRISPDDLGIWKDDHILFLKRIAEFIDLMGAVPGIQLAHAGRKASMHSPFKGGSTLTAAEGAWQTVAPSVIPFSDTYPVPRELTTLEIQQVVADFKQAAVRALAAGFKVIELHAAHGYLLNEFMSPISNHRKDEYGGSFENNIRVLLETITAVRSVWPDHLPLFVRISASDWVEGGWTAEDSVKLAIILKNHEVDLIDCSSGGNSSQAKIPVGPLYQAHFAEKVKKETGMMTGAVGLITTAAEAEQLIASGGADLVVMARQLLRDPYFPLHAAHDLHTDIHWPKQYDRAKRY